MGNHPQYLGNGAIHYMIIAYELSIDTEIGDLERHNGRYFALFDRIR